MIPTTFSLMIMLTSKFPSFNNSLYSEDECIVDVKDPISGKNLRYNKTIGKYVCKVEPIRVILEQDYFIQLIEKAEKARDK